MERENDFGIKYNAFCYSCQHCQPKDNYYLCKKSCKMVARKYMCGLYEPSTFVARAGEGGGNVKTPQYIEWLSSNAKRLESMYEKVCNCKKPTKTGKWTKFVRSLFLAEGGKKIYLCNE